VTILGTLIRQCLEASRVPADVEARLEELIKEFADADDLVEVMLAVCASSPNLIFVLDGLDECERQERASVLSALQKMMHSSQSRVKVFIASRRDFGPKLKRSLRIDHHLSLSVAEVHSDIYTYIEAIIVEKVSAG